MQRLRTWLLLPLLFLLISFNPNAANAQVDPGRIEGEISIHVFDFPDGSDLLGLEIRVKGERRKKILTVRGIKSLDDLPPLNLVTGDKVSIRGARLMGNGRLHVRRKSDIRKIDMGSSEDLVSPAAVSKKVVVLRITSSDGSVPCTKAQLESFFFSTTSKSIRGLYEEASYNAASFLSDGDNNGLIDVHEVTIARSTSGLCEHSQIASDANAALSAQGISVSNFDFRVYMMPNNMNCGWAGLGTLGNGAGNSWVPGQYCNYPDVSAHEIGHNYGLHHAGTDTNNDNTLDCTYCDTSCQMGYAGNGWRHFNSLHKHQMGWIVPEKQGPLVSGQYRISALEQDPALAQHKQILSAPRASGNSYFVSYREAIGSHSVNLSTNYAGRVSIHYGTTTRGWSYLVKALQDGEIFTDAASGISIQQISHGSGEAEILVSANAAPTPTSTPTSTPTPSVTNTPTPIPTATPTVAPAYMFVNNIGMSIARKGARFTVTGEVNIKRLGSLANINGAAVTGNFYKNGDFLATITKSTKASGNAALSTSVQVQSGDVLRLDIINVSKSGFIYDSGSNIESSDSITVP